MTTEIMTPIETDALTVRTKVTWTAGDFGKIAKAYEPGAANFITNLNLQSDDRVLDVACGTGNLAIPAARSSSPVARVGTPSAAASSGAWVPFPAPGFPKRTMIMGGECGDRWDRSPRYAS